MVRRREAAATAIVTTVKITKTEEEVGGITNIYDTIRHWQKFYQKSAQTEKCQRRQKDAIQNPLEPREEQLLHYGPDLVMVRRTMSANLQKTSC